MSKKKEIKTKQAKQTKKILCDDICAYEPCPCQPPPRLNNLPDVIKEGQQELSSCHFVESPAPLALMSYLPGTSKPQDRKKKKYNEELDFSTPVRALPGVPQKTYHFLGTSQNMPKKNCDEVPCL